MIVHQQQHKLTAATAANDLHDKPYPIWVQWFFVLSLMLVLFVTCSSHVVAQSYPGQSPANVEQVGWRHRVNGSGYPLIPPSGGAIPARPQLYEYLPPDRASIYQPSPLDQFLLNVGRQTYGKFEYLNWSVSDPGSGYLGAPAKRIGEGLGFTQEVFIDGTALNFPLLREISEDLVLVQIWDNTTDSDGDGDRDINDISNDPDIFPATTDAQNTAFLTGADTNLILSNVITTPTLIPSQVAVLTIGQVVNKNFIGQDNQNGFRGVVGVTSTFGAFETDFWTLTQSRSQYNFAPLPSGLTTGFTSNGTTGATDPVAIPYLVNGQMAPDVTNSLTNNLLTDSNNFYVLYNQSYFARFESESYAVTPRILWTLHEDARGWKVMLNTGFRYFNLNDRLTQQGVFTEDVNNGDYVYDSQVPNADLPLTSTIISRSSNDVYGGVLGFRTVLDHNWLKLVCDFNGLLGGYVQDSEVAVNDLLFVGDDNFTRDRTTGFVPGLDLTIDTQLQIHPHVWLTFGYNLFWLSNVTRAVNNVYYDITATNTGGTFTYQNNVIVAPDQSQIFIHGINVGVLIDW